jgi:hypothetical protein
MAIATAYTGSSFHLKATLLLAAMIGWWGCGMWSQGKIYQRFNFKANRGVSIGSEYQAVII